MPEHQNRKPVILPPGEGRPYSMGRISSVFKADADESADTFSVSEWWVEPKTEGPPPHSHKEDHVFYVLEGVMNILLGEEWSECTKGSCVIIPGGTVHTFENRGSTRAGILSFNNSAGFESDMPAIVDCSRKNPPGDVS